MKVIFFQWYCRILLIEFFNLDFFASSFLIIYMGVPSADFFPGEGKNFPEGEGLQEPTFCLKTNKKLLFYQKKSKNILFLAGLGRPGAARAPLASPCGRPCIFNILSIKVEHEAWASKHKGAP
jgi:hypothetical protein